MRPRACGPRPPALRLTTHAPCGMKSPDACPNGPVMGQSFAPEVPSSSVVWMSVSWKTALRADRQFSCAAVRTLLIVFAMPSSSSVSVRTWMTFVESGGAALKVLVHVRAHRTVLAITGSGIGGDYASTKGERAPGRVSSLPEAEDAFRITVGRQGPTPQGERPWP